MVLETKVCVFALIRQWSQQHQLKEECLRQNSYNIWREVKLTDKAAAGRVW